MPQNGKHKKWETSVIEANSFTFGAFFLPNIGTREKSCARGPAVKIIILPRLQEEAHEVPLKDLLLNLQKEEVPHADTSKPLLIDGFYIKVAQK
eukprot:910674-Amphidinium_carterae.1